MKGSQANEYFRNAHIVISEVLFSLLGTANILGVMYDLNTNCTEELLTGLARSVAEYSRYYPGETG